MVGGYTKDLKELMDMHAQEFTVPYNEFIEHNWLLVLKHNTFWYTHSVVGHKWELLIIRAVIMSQECTQSSGHANVSKSLLLYSAKFSRRIGFAVFADSSGTAKIKLLKIFWQNFPGVLSIVWKQYDSYSTFAVLCGRQEQHGTLSLFQSERFQIPGGRHRKFLWH